MNGEAVRTSVRRSSAYAATAATRSAGELTMRRIHGTSAPGEEGLSYRSSLPLGRNKSQRPPNSTTFWQSTWPGLRSPT